MGEDHRFLPYGRHCIEDDDIAAVVEVLRGDWLTTGPRVADLERATTERTGAAHAVACANGTAALHLAMLALGIGPGDAVVVPSLTFLASANCARYVGADVVFADVDSDTGLLTPDTLRAALERARAAGQTPRAVVPVHLTGQCVDLAGLAPVAAEHGLKIVEDACHAIGTRVMEDGAWVPVGRCRRSDIAVFSLHPVKTVAMGEGGLLTTNDAEIAERLRRLRSHGMVLDPSQFEVTEQAFGPGGQPNPWYYEMPEPGYNYRATDLQCALGLSQIAKLERFVATRRALVAAYDRYLEPLAPVVRPIRRIKGCDPAWHLYAAAIDFAAAGTSRGDLMRALRADGIGTQVHYLPVHRQPYYRRVSPTPPLPGADAYYARTLSLPLFVGMTERDVERVVAALARHLGTPA